MFAWLYEWFMIVVIWVLSWLGIQLPMPIAHANSESASVSGDESAIVPTSVQSSPQDL